MARLLENIEETADTGIHVLIGAAYPESRLAASRKAKTTAEARKAMRQHMLQAINISNPIMSDPNLHNIPMSWDGTAAEIGSEANWIAVAVCW